MIKITWNSINRVIHLKTQVTHRTIVVREWVLWRMLCLVVVQLMLLHVSRMLLLLFLLRLSSSSLKSLPGPQLYRLEDWLLSSWYDILEWLKFTLWALPGCNIGVVSLSSSYSGDGVNIGAFCLVLFLFLSYRAYLLYSSTSLLMLLFHLHIMAVQKISIILATVIKHITLR